MSPRVRLTVHTSDCSLGRSMLHESMHLLDSQGHQKASGILKTFDDHLHQISVSTERAKEGEPNLQKGRAHAEILAT